MIYLINSYGKEIIGHFWVWDKQFRKAFNEFNWDFAYVNPSANLAMNEDGFESLGTYLKTNPQINFIAETINLINIDLASREEKSIILVFPYLAQFTTSELQEIIYSINKKGLNISVAGVSNLSDQAMMNIPTSQRYLMQDYFNELPLPKILWAFEKIPTEFKHFDFIRELPDFIKSEKSVENRSGKLTFFGSLNAYRGITEILIIALLNPRLKIYIKGHGFAKNRIWRPIKFRSLIFTNWKQKPFIALPMNAVSILLSFLIYLPNVDFSSQPFLEEGELDSAIKNSGSLFFCAKLQFGSGIVAKSLYSEIPIIWCGKSGHAFDMLQKNYPIGKIEYKDIFIPNRINKKLRLITGISSAPPFTWEDVKNSIFEITSLAN